MRKKILPVLMAAALLTIPASAYGSEKINSINVTFHAEDSGTEGIPDVEAEVKSSHYSAGNVSLASEYYAGDETNEKKYKNDIQTYVVELSADDGYYFNITKSKSIKVNGEGAEFIKASRRDNGSTLIITAKLTKIESYLGNVDYAQWDDNGYGNWEAANGALFYRLKITDSKNKSRTVETGGLQYDLRPFMIREGSYTYKVKPVSADGRQGLWSATATHYVSKEEAERNKENFKVLTESTFLGDEKTPGNQQIRYLNTGWQKGENGRYFYRNQDGSYIQQNWLNEGDVWYFFDKDGYMVSNDYAVWGEKDYYFGENGAMQVGGKAPDGRAIDENGALEGLSKTLEDKSSLGGPGTDETLAEEETEAEEETWGHP